MSASKREKNFLAGVKRVLKSIPFLHSLIYCFRRRRARMPYRLDNWKIKVMRYYKWDIENDPEVYTKICTGYTKEKFEDVDTGSMVYFLNPSKEDICLNIGCGAARVEKFLSLKVKEIHSVDFAEAMIKMGKKRLQGYKNVHFYKNDGESLGMFSGNMFDIAWSELVFQHIPPEIVKKYIDEVYRVLKPGGRFICMISSEKYSSHSRRDLTGWMSKREIEEAFSEFSELSFLKDKRYERWWVPIAVK